MNTFFAELKRRNVFKVGVAYAIVAWLIMQVVETFFPALHIPEWTITFIAVLLIIGFPLAVFLAWAYELTPEGIKPTSTVTPGQGITQSKGQLLNYIILGLVVLAVVFMLVDNYVLKNTTSTPVVLSTAVQGVSKTPSATLSTTVAAAPEPEAGLSRRYYLPLGLTRPIIGPNIDGIVAISPDGQQLVYAVNTETGPQLLHRNLLQLSARPLPAPTGTIHDVFFSPDGEWVGVGMSIPNGMYKISLQGGSPQLLTRNVSLAFGGYWAGDGYIYFSTLTPLKLHRIRASGGEVEQVNVQLRDAEWFHSWPAGLPDDTHLLLTVTPTPLDASNGQIALVSLASGEDRILIQNGYHARYVPTGHIVFMRSESLWAVPFDAERLEITGREVPVVNGVQTASALGQAVYAFSEEGLLVYMPGRDMQMTETQFLKKLVWVDREGNESPLAAKAQDYAIPRLSPDETQIAVRIGNHDGYDIWTYDLNRDILSRRTFGGDADVPLWTPDGDRLVYGYYPTASKGLAWVKADGTGQPEQLLDVNQFLTPASFTPDGSQLIYFELMTGAIDLHVLSMTQERTERPLLATEFSERQAVISPDGHWMAYQSDETGQVEIYIRPFPNVDDGKWQVSVDGGEEPLWRGDGKELFYRKGARPVTIVAVPVESGSEFQIGKPVELFTGDYYVHDSSISYDVTADGQQFITLKPVKNSHEEGDISSQQTNLVAVENWFDELKRLAPSSN